MRRGASQRLPTARGVAGEGVLLDSRASRSPWFPPGPVNHSRESARRFGDLLIGENERIAKRQRQVILARDRLQLYRKPHRPIEIGAERDHAVTGEKATIAPLERLERVVRQLLRAVAGVTRTAYRRTAERRSVWQAGISSGGGQHCA